MERSQLKIAFNSDCVFPQYWLHTCGHLPLSLKMLPQVICGPPASCIVLHIHTAHTHAYAGRSVCVWLSVCGFCQGKCYTVIPFYMWQIASRAAVESALP